MSLLGSLGNLIKRIFSKIFDFIKKIFKKFWWVLLIIAIVWFAPTILAWLTTAGAPSWLIAGTSWVATNVTPLLVSAGTWLWSGAGSLLSAAWTGYTSLGIGTQAAIALGAAALLAPEETQQVLDDAITTAGEIVGVVTGAVGSALSKSPLVWVGLAGLAAWLFFGSDEDDDRKAELEEKRAERAERAEIRKGAAAARLARKETTEGSNNA